MDSKRLLDTIIDRYAVREEKPHVECTTPQVAYEHYVCTRDGENYVVAYDQALQLAYYFFKEALVKDPLEIPISHEQRDYYVRTNYWSKDC